MQIKNFHWLSNMGYEPLYMTVQCTSMMTKSTIVTFHLYLQSKVGKIYIYIFLGIFNKQLFLLHLLDNNEMIANSAL